MFSPYSDIGDTVSRGVVMMCHVIDWLTRREVVEFDNLESSLRFLCFRAYFSGRDLSYNGYRFLQITIPGLQYLARIS